MTTKAEREHMSRVASLGCIICGGPAEFHHIKEGRYSQKKSSNFHGIPLCQWHHRLGGHGVAIEAGIETWREIYGSEWDLLDRTRARLEAEFGWMEVKR